MNKQSPSVVNRIDLDFFQNSFEKNIEILKLYSSEDWVKEVFSFLTLYLNTDYIESKTSGTTGIPKVITHRKDQLQTSAKHTLDFFGLNPGDRVVSALSTQFIAGKMMIVRAVEGKLKLTLIRPTSNPLVFLLPSEVFKFCPLVPIQISEIVRLGKLQYMRRLGVLLVGGGALNNNILKELTSEKIEVFASYGMTETMTHFALKKLSPIADDSYKCLPGYNISVDHQGCMLVMNDELFDQPIKTNDLVNVISSTQFNWLGRADNRINSGGIKIYPEQVESKIRARFPDLSSFIILGEADERLGQRVIFCTEEGTTLPENFKSEMDLLVSKYEKPAAFKKVRAFEYTSTGKLIRNNLKFI